MKLRYGKSEVEIEGLPGRVEILEPPKIDSIEDPVGVMREALLNPVDSPPLGAIVRDGMKVLLLHPDKTRKYNTATVFPDLVREVARLAGGEENVAVLFARGTHGEMSRADMEAAAGILPAAVRVFQHDCDSDDLVHVGTTSRGTPVRVNSLLGKHDRVLGICGVIPHHFAGMSGGRKLILPGVCGRGTIETNHRHVLHPTEPRLNPAATTGKFAGNPVHEDMMEAAAFVKPQFLVCVVTDASGRLILVTAGDFFSSHAKACDFVMARFFSPVSSKADLVIASTGGHPADINFIQSYKTLSCAVKVAKPAAPVVLLAACPDGSGSERVAELIKTSSNEDLYEELRRRYEVEGRCVMATRQMAAQHPIHVLTAMSEEITRRLGLRICRDAGEAVRAASVKLPPDPLCYVIPAGISFFPSACEQ